MKSSDWLKIVEELKSIAQNGLTYCDNHFDIERYEQIQELAAKIIANNTEYNTNQIIDIFAKDQGYLTPKLDVRAAIFKSGKILLSKEKADQRWSLPGGFADVNESPKEAIAREVKEETDVEVKVIRLIALWDRQKHNHPSQIPHVYKAVFCCEVISEPKQFVSNHEIIDTGWFVKEQLPSMSLGRILPEQIHRLFNLYENNVIETEFD